MITREPHAWNLRVKNTWEHAHKFSETACKIVHLDCIHLTTFIFGWNLWSNAQWSLAVELCKCMLNIGHILGKTQTDCFSHLTVSKLLSIRFWNATYTECIVHVVYLCACKENCSLQIYLFSVQVYVLCCKGFFHKRDVHARMTEMPYCRSKSLFTALIWGSKCK